MDKVAHFRGVDGPFGKSVVYFPVVLFYRHLIPVHLGDVGDVTGAAHSLGSWVPLSDGSDGGLIIDEEPDLPSVVIPVAGVTKLAAFHRVGKINPVLVETPSHKRGAL